MGLPQLPDCYSNLFPCLRYLNPLKTIFEEVIICNEVARCQPASLQKKLFHTSSFMYFAFIFSKCITITSSGEGLNVCEYNFFQRKVVLLVLYLFNHDSFKRTIFTIFLLNMSFEVLLSAVSCNIKLFALRFGRYFFHYSPPWLIIFYFDIYIKFTLSTIISTRKE